MRWIWLFAATVIVSTGGFCQDVPRNLIQNDGFEDGLQAWSTSNGWYEAGGQGKGHGVSAWTVDDTVFHSGGKSLRVDGKSNRGLAMQVFPIYHRRFRVTGWIRTRGIDKGVARLLVEYLDRDGKWLRGDTVGGVSGDSDWTKVEGEVEPPAEARTVHFDLGTTDANNGTAWFDDIAMTDATPDTTPPAPVALDAKLPPAPRGTLCLSWQDAKPEDDVMQFRVYVELKPFLVATTLMPRQIVDRDTRQCLLIGLEPLRTYYAAVVAVDYDGNWNPVVQTRKLVTNDTQPPRPVAVTVETVASPFGAAIVHIRPHPWDSDLAGFEVAVTTEPLQKLPANSQRFGPDMRQIDLVGSGHGGKRYVSMAAVDVAGNVGPVTSCGFEAKVEQEGRSKMNEIVGSVRNAAGQPVSNASVVAVSASGMSLEARSGADGKYVIRSEGKQKPLLPAQYTVTATAGGFCESAPVDAFVATGGQTRVDVVLHPLSAAQFDVWTMPSIANVFPDASPPHGDTDATPSVELWAARGGTRAAQVVVRPRRELKGVRLLFSTLRATDGAVIAPDAADYHFVDTIHVDKNSTATPKEKLLRAAPADFPDPFSEDTQRDLPPERAQPIFVRVHVPRGAGPGLYVGHISLITDVGVTCIPLRVQVLPFELPKVQPLYVTNWFSPERIAAAHGVDLWSADFWDLLRVYAKDMAAHGQTVCATPLSTIQVYADDGQFHFNFSRLDAWVDLFTAAGVGRRIELMHIGGRASGKWEEPHFIAYPRYATDLKTGRQVEVPLETYLGALQQHLKEKGWLDRALLHIGDEPIPVNVDSWVELSKRVHAAAPELKRIDAIHVPPESLQGQLEVMVPQLNYFDQWHEQFMKAQAAGAEVWFYLAWVPQGDYMNRLIDFPATKSYLIPWLNFTMGATGFLHWGLNQWTPGLKDMGFAPGDNWIIYPGKFGPRSSLRWEAMAEGFEDYEWLRILVQTGEEYRRRTAAPAGFDPMQRPMQLAEKIVKSPTDYSIDPDKIERVRREIAREIVSLREKTALFGR